jgi:radical SAM-linked protein
VHRVLLKLRKGEAVKYLSHGDMVRAFEFAVRRAGIPVAYSSGFNPRPRMSFSSAIGVGVTSDDERIVLELIHPESPSYVQKRLNAVMPKGMEVVCAKDVPEEVKSPLSKLNASEFRLTLMSSSFPNGNVEVAINELLARPEVRIRREREGKTKEVDIRPGILEVHVSAGDGGVFVVNVSLRTGESGGVRPQDFIKALEEYVPDLSVKSIHRVRQFHVEC